MLEISDRAVISLVERDRESDLAVEFTEFRHLDIHNRDAGRFQLVEACAERRLGIAVEIGERGLLNADADLPQVRGLDRTAAQANDSALPRAP